MAHTLSPSGAVLDTREYDAYGREVAARLPSGASSYPSDPFGFDAKWGYYYDRELCTYHCQSRNYDPGTARWLERDPIGLAGGVNPHSYCAANPVGAIDPEGTSVLIGTAATLPHGNTIGDQYCEFYFRYGASGEYLKCGIARDAATRYNKTGPGGLNGDTVRVLATGTRKQMAALEDACRREYGGMRESPLIEGTLHGERTAGAGLKPGQVPFVDQLARFQYEGPPQADGRFFSTPEGIGGGAGIGEGACGALGILGAIAGFKDFYDTFSGRTRYYMIS